MQGKEEKPVKKLGKGMLGEPPNRDCPFFSAQVTEGSEGGAGLALFLPMELRDEPWVERAGLCIQAFRFNSPFSLCLPGPQQVLRT
jgi:hypothetical protein